MVPLSCPPTRSPPPLSRRGAVSLREHLSANGYTQVDLGKVQKCVQKKADDNKSAIEKHQGKSCVYRFVHMSRQCLLHSTVQSQEPSYFKTFIETWAGCKMSMLSFHIPLYKQKSMPKRKLTSFLQSCWHKISTHKEALTQCTRFLSDWKSFPISLNMPPLTWEEYDKGKRHVLCCHCWHAACVVPCSYLLSRILGVCSPILGTMSFCGG